MSPRYLPFVDWLKVAGLTLIVWGHVAASTTVTWTPPVYPKQLGVAFFVFVTGVTLAREERRSARAVYNRCFEVYFIALACALFMTVVGLLLGAGPNLSNYLPLALGLNVVMNAFPANPTTWYVGTYLHILLAWAVVLRRVRIRPWIVILWLPVEIALRATLIETRGPYVAYMMLSNWLGVFVLGLAVGQSEVVGRRRAVLPAACAVIFFAAWPLTMALIDWQLTFPFMGLASARHTAATLLVGSLVSLVYLAYTMAAYTVVRGLRAPAVVRIIARNTVMVFIAHMPVYYLLEYLLRPTVSQYSARVTIEFLVCLPGLVLVSEVVRRVLRPDLMRDQLARRYSRAMRTWSVAPSRG